MTKVNIMERTEEGHQIMASDTVVGKFVCYHGCHHGSEYKEGGLKICSVDNRSDH